MRTPLSPISASTKRSRTAATIVTLALALVLAACGGDSSDDGSNDTSSGSPASSSLVPPAEGKTDYPLTVETRFGEVVIDSRPERVVAGDDWEIDLLAALDVTPVGTNDQADFRAYATKQLSGSIETTWSNLDVEFPAESILTTDPDLIDIVGSVEEPTNYGELSKIAPTLGPPPSDDDMASWQDRLRLLGKVLDLSDRAEQAIADNTAYFEKVRADHPEFEGKTAAFINFWGNGVPTGYLSSPGSGSYTLLSDLGFTPNPDSDRFTDSEDLSPELVGSIKADVIIINDGSGDPAQLQQFLDDPLFQTLPAVENGRLVVLANPEQTDVTQDGEIIAAGFGHFGRAMGGSGPVPQQAIADFLVPVLSEATKN